MGGFPMIEEFRKRDGIRNWHIVSALVTMERLFRGFLTIIKKFGQEFRRVDLIYD